MPRIPKHKVVKVPEFREVIYDVKKWEILKRLRIRASKIMEYLIRCGLKPITHGSIARGDVDEESDIDIVIPYNVQPYLVELCIERYRIHVYSKYIVKATPKLTPKAYLELDPEGKETISFPLGKLTPREWEFYRFGGMITYEELMSNKRVPGVNKSLILIIPTDLGHKEAPVIGYEEYVAKILDISIETVKERVKVLTRRDRYGRTGVFLKYSLQGNESFEEALNRLIEEGKLKLDFQ